MEILLLEENFHWLKFQTDHHITERKKGFVQVLLKHCPTKKNEPTGKERRVAELW